MILIPLDVLDRRPIEGLRLLVEQATNELALLERLNEENPSSWTAKRLDQERLCLTYYTAVYVLRLGQ